MFWFPDVASCPWSSRQVEEHRSCLIKHETGDATASNARHTEKESLARAATNEVLIRDAENLHDTCKLLLLVLAREDREARVQLSHDAT